MANVIKHKRGSGSDPVASDLVVGEVAIRTDVGKLFTKMDNGSVAEIAGGGSDIAINTLSSSSATGGGSATFNGSAYRFTLSQPPSVSAQQLLVSINGVIQKPVAGTGQPSEGFSVDGTDIILGDAPATGSDFFILTFKSLGVSEPADNSVTSAKIVDGAIVNADINASAAIAGTKISPNFGSQNIATTGTLSITSAAPQIFLTDSNANSDYAIVVNTGQFRIRDETNSANRLAVNSDGHVDIYGRLDVEGGIQIPVDNQKLQIGASQDLQIYHDGSNSFIKDGGTGSLKILSNQVQIIDANNSENIANFNENGAVELYFNNSKKFETKSSGIGVTGNLEVGSGQITCGVHGTTGIQIINDGTFGTLHSADLTFRTVSATRATIDTSGNFNIPNDSGKIRLGASQDLQIYHDGTVSHIDNGTEKIVLGGGVIYLRPTGTENGVVVVANGAVQLHWNNQIRYTTQNGFGVHYGHFSSNANGSHDLGFSGSRWRNIYYSGSVTTSDKNEKNTITKSDLGLDFIKKLNPVSFKWNKETLDDKTHYGLIAQEVEETILNMGKKLEDFGAVDKPTTQEEGKDYAVTKDESTNMGLNYTELIAPLIKAVQELTAKVEALEAK